MTHREMYYKIFEKYEEMRDYRFTLTHEGFGRIKSEILG